MCRSDRLETAATKLLDAILQLPEETRMKAPFCDWLSPLTAIKRNKSDVSAAVILPLTAMHAHLVSTMKLRVPLRDGRLLNLSYAQATAVLKTSDDPRSDFAVDGHARTPCFNHEVTRPPS